MKKWGLILLILHLLCAWPALAEMQGDFLYEVQPDGTAIITGYIFDHYIDGKKHYYGNANAIVPAQIDGHPVVSIDEGAFLNGWYMESITLPDGIISIGDRAFQNCAMLKEMILPDSIETIGTGAFDNCEALEWVAMPEKLKRIEDGAFRGCRQLTQVTLPEGVESIGYAAFAYGGLGKINLPESIRYVDAEAFSNTMMGTIIAPEGSVGANLAIKAGYSLETYPGEARSRVHTEKGSIKMMLENSYSQGTDSLWVSQGASYSVRLLDPAQIIEGYQLSTSALGVHLEATNQCMVKGLLCTFNGIGETIIRLVRDRDGQVLDEIRVNVVMLDMEKDKATRQILIGDLDRVDWDKRSLFLGRHIAITDYEKKESTMCFKAYNDSQITYALVSYDETGAEIDRAYLEAHDAASNIIASMGNTFSGFSRDFSGKDGVANENLTRETKVSLKIREGGCVIFCQPNEDSTLFLTNLGQLVIRAIDAAGSTKDVLGEGFSDDLFKTAVKSLSPEDMTFIFTEVLRTHSNIVIGKVIQDASMNTIAGLLKDKDAILDLSMAMAKYIVEHWEELGLTFLGELTKAGKKAFTDALQDGILIALAPVSGGLSAELMALFDGVNALVDSMEFSNLAGGLKECLEGEVFTNISYILLPSPDSLYEAKVRGTLREWAPAPVQVTPTPVPAPAVGVAYPIPMVSAKEINIFSVSDRYVSICADDLWGVFDPMNRKFILPCNNEYVASAYSEGMLAFIGEDILGYLDENGSIAIALDKNDYRSVGDFHDGLAHVISRKIDGSGYIDKSGNLVIPSRWDYLYDFHNGLAIVEKDGLMGWIDTSGRQVIPCQWDYISPFSEGLAAVNKDGKWGYVSVSGQVVAPCQWDRVSDFSSGIARVCQGELWGYIRSDGSILHPCEFEKAYDFHGEGALCMGPYSSLYLINKSGKTTRITGNISHYDPAFRGGLASISVNNHKKNSISLTGFINPSGEWVIPCEYDWAWHMTEGLIAVQKNKWAGYLDATGQIAIPLKFSDVREFSEGMAAVMVKDTWGYIDTTGTLVIPCAWETAATFKNGVAVVANNKEYCVINKQGQIIVPVEAKLKRCISQAVNGQIQITILDQEGNLFVYYAEE